MPTNPQSNPDDRESPLEPQSETAQSTNGYCVHAAVLVDCVVPSGLGTLVFPHNFFAMTPLPAQYQWLHKVKGLPRTIAECIKLHGVQEVVGKGSNATIIAWRDELNGATTNGKPIVTGFSDDDIAWCGLFAAIIAYRRVKNILAVVKGPLWARNWLNYGVKVGTAMLGDCLVFERGKGGHVGWYVGEDATTLHVFGGNQSNRVSIARIAKSRLLGIRRPVYSVVPAGVDVYRLAASGAISTNEA